MCLLSSDQKLGLHRGRLQLESSLRELNELKLSLPWIKRLRLLSEKMCVNPISPCGPQLIEEHYKEKLRFGRLFSFEQMFQ